MLADDLKAFDENFWKKQIFESYDKKFDEKETNILRMITYAQIETLGKLWEILDDEEKKGWDLAVGNYKHLFRMFYLRKLFYPILKKQENLEKSDLEKIKMWFFAYKLVDWLMEKKKYLNTTEWILLLSLLFGYKNDNIDNINNIKIDDIKVGNVNIKDIDQLKEKVFDVLEKIGKKDLIEKIKVELKNENFFENEEMLGEFSSIERILKD